MTAPTTAVAWFERMPYQGWDSSSRRSIEDRNATHAPAVGPPRIIAAPTNGMWNVIVEPPGARRTRIEPNRPNRSHSRRPPVGPARTVPAGKPGSMRSSGSFAIEVQARSDSPRTIDAAV
jgi:hypothetical protein